MLNIKSLSFFFRSLSSERHKIHMNLALSLLLAQSLFLAGIRKTSNKVGQLSYEATDVGSRSAVGSYVPVKERSVNDI